MSPPISPPIPYFGAKQRIAPQLAQGRGHHRRRTGWRNVVQPRGADRIGLPDYLTAYVARIHTAAGRLADVSLECRPALEVIDQYGRHPEVLLYVDPPYVGSTRPGSRLTYLHDMPEEAEHVELISALRRARAAVVLSGYRCDLYDAELAGWSSVDIPATSGHGVVVARTETIWSNRPAEAPGLFDADRGQR